jgi:hypothetical protein
MTSEAASEEMTSSEKADLFLDNVLAWVLRPVKVAAPNELAFIWCFRMAAVLTHERPFLFLQVGYRE